MSAAYVTNLSGCARCAGAHHDIEWEPLDRPVVDRDGTTWTHWVPCPTNGQPILMRFSQPAGAGE